MVSGCCFLNLVSAKNVAHFPPVVSVVSIFYLGLLTWLVSRFLWTSLPLLPHSNCQTLYGTISGLLVLISQIPFDIIPAALTHQSDPGSLLYLCMHLLLQVAPQELRRHKQPNAIDERRHSFTTIAVIPSASNPPVKNVHKRTKKTPSCCEFSLIFKKSSHPWCAQSCPM